LRPLELAKGFPGKPSHPPLTDVSIGAYTAGVAMLVAGAVGLQERQMAHGALLAISVGLLLAVPTALTGLLDWLDLAPGTPARTMATIHLLAMVTATVLFALTWLAQRPGYVDDEVRTLGLILGLLAEATLASGGYIGGTLSFVYGVRVLKRPATPPRDALVPGRLPPDGAPAAPPPTAPSTPLAQSSSGKEPKLRAQRPGHRRTRR
jgi:uncharacterized membrane protein